MSDDDDPYASLWNHAPPPHLPRPAERVFEFIRASDGGRMVVEVQFHGEPYGWDARILEADGGWLSHAHSRFHTRALATRWAEVEREFLASGSPRAGSTVNCRVGLTGFYHLTADPRGLD